MKPVMNKNQLYLNGNERCDFEIWCKDWICDDIGKTLVDVIVEIDYEGLKKISQYGTID